MKQLLKKEDLTYFVGFVCTTLGILGTILLKKSFHSGFSLNTYLTGLLWIIAIGCAFALVITNLQLLNAQRRNFLLVLLFLLGIYKIIPENFLPWTATTWINVTLFFLAATLAWLAASQPKINVKKLQQSIAATSLIYFISFSILSFAQGIGGEQHKTLNFTKFSDLNGAHNVLVLLLDETSPEYADKLTHKIIQSGFQVRVHTVASAGENTINALPSMLVNQRHDSVSPCSRTMLCGDFPIDFSNLTAALRKTDAIGFHLPYCAIGGLRSCYQARLTDNPADLGYLGWAISRACSYLPRSVGEMVCQSSGLNRPPFIELRDIMTNKLLEAPFWKEGGYLFAHMPLPHLPARIAHYTATESYEANIIEASQLIATITNKLKSTFGDDYIFIITSDHAFRKPKECDVDTRNAQHCSTFQGLPSNQYKVPMIIVTLTPLDKSLLITSNIGLFF